MGCILHANVLHANILHANILHANIIHGVQHHAAQKTHEFLSYDQSPLTPFPREGGGGGEMRKGEGEGIDIERVTTLDK